MDVSALLSALRSARVADGYYWIEGVHEPAPTPPDFVYLRRAADDGTWEVGTYERGARHPLTRHGDEASACAHMLRLLT
ncbi:hypothetical protein DCW30_00855 [Streptomyces alfalfae]|uniref:Uncharacterized protein n=1 Tax=Streptomyces alfalfae TaxID=1642299 RepID=A0A1P8TBE4_9ACTN|nr:hypothetical protein [Streptomyces alfalfae]APY84905.1 hypothetical protein A7J05_03300 [Streptomyces alfalfae]QQC92973.1 hypothetical protein I8755_34990 [Streptomyces alfalfae]QUI35277.1 hypothetical protein H9W91_33970 [Streptomyces alfalfae]RXX35009.1 hypothetical protein DCW30_36390 [Streptomyces alfalfae]RXX45783.1 hypothetical protein DCW30_07885 [Streptomyces alfalfae]